MTTVDTVADFPSAERRVVVINVHTDLVAVRAVLSAGRYTNAKVLVINCDPTDASQRVFKRLLGHCEFDLIEAPVRPHGAVLDRLFKAAPDERLILLDSDAEIRDGSFIEWMSAKLDNGRAFGAGFLWGPFLIDTEWAAPANAQFLYMERPWIPCVELKVGPVRDALMAGCTFNYSWSPNEFPFVPRVANFLGARWGPPWGMKSRLFSRLPSPVKEYMSDKKLDGLRWARQEYCGYRPHMVIRDTGCAVYDYLRREKGMLFAGIPVELNSGEIHHYLGVTRRVVHGKTALDRSEQDVAEEVIDRLHQVYGYEWDPET